MRIPAILAALSPLFIVAACNDRNDAAEDRMEQTAETSAMQAGPAEVALGLSEAQLLNADIVGPNGVELGDVAAVVRDAGGKVDRLLVEVEDSNPDRFVHVPIAGLTPVVRGTDTDLSTTMTVQQIRALPAVALPTATASPAP